MAIKVLFLLVVVFVVFETEAFTYRRNYYDSESPFMKLMEDMDPYRRSMAIEQDPQCADVDPLFCKNWASGEYCHRDSFYTHKENFRMFTQKLCKKSCGYC